MFDAIEDTPAPVMWAPASLTTALEVARDRIFEAFELLADRDDVPDAVVFSIQEAYRKVRQLEVSTNTEN